MDMLLFAFIVSLVINIVMFIPAYLYKTDKITDISYAVTFATVALASYSVSTKTTLHAIILMLILLWSFRLGTFLFIRINKIGKDTRFDTIREHFFPFLRFWVVQGITVFVVMMAPLVALSQTTTNITDVAFLGMVVFIVGLLIEAIADDQKFKFNGNLVNKGRWINSGIWRASRHPNYLGEMMVWVGMFLIVLPSIHGLAIPFAVLSPAYIICLLLFVSGIPILEKSAERRWGDNKNYQTYKREVPVLIPTFNSLRRLIK